jgi:hypothetical protein
MISYSRQIHVSVNVNFVDRLSLSDMRQCVAVAHLIDMYFCFETSWALALITQLGLLKNHFSCVRNYSFCALFSQAPQLVASNTISSITSEKHCKKIKTPRVIVRRINKLHEIIDNSNLIESM